MTADTAIHQCSDLLVARPTVSISNPQFPADGQADGRSTDEVLDNLSLDSV